MYDYTATGPVSTTKNPLLESVIVCLVGILVLITL
jgi:hypothetical protein